MNDSLLCRLLRYPSAPDRRPFENFCTEALAWSINEWPEFGRAICGLWLEEGLGDGDEVEAKTQQHVPGGFVDLMLETGPSDRKKKVVIVEVKVDAGIGEREGPEEDDEDETADECDADAWTQIDNYLEYAKQTSAYVAILSRDHVTERPTWKTHQWLGVKRWDDVRRLLDELPQVGDVQEFIVKEWKALMDENDLALQKVDSSLTTGSPNIVRLGRFFEEAVSEVSQSRNFNAGGYRADRWTIHLTLKTESGVKIGGPAYSFKHCDTSFFFNPEFSGRKGLLEKLRSILPECQGPTSGRWWGLVFVPLVNLDEFFSLEAPDQLKMLSTRIAEVLDKIAPLVPQ